MNLYDYCLPLLVILQYANQPARAIDCAYVHNLVLSNITQTQDSSHSDSPKNATSQRLCGSTGADCCNSTLVGPIVRGHEVPRAWFDNSIKYNHFRDKLNTHIQYMGNTPSNNETLWNATLSGLNVFKHWGVKYWDSDFLRSNVFTNECATKIAQAAACGVCVTGVPVQACKSLCQNVVMGCVKSPLAEYIEGPWKHAVNSVRTAVRLIITNNDKQDTTQLNEIMNDLNLWREPISWWTEENNACDLLPEANCWNGEAVGSYEFPVVRWRQSFNPEFTDKRASAVNHSVMLQLDKFHNELIQVRKSLEKYWPTSGSDTRFANPQMVLPITSSEEIIDGSGYDDEDMEYAWTSGEGSDMIPKPIDSDDEDLPGYEGSGSGDSEESPTRQEDVEGEPQSPTTSRPPVGLNNSVLLTLNVCVLFLCCLLRSLGQIYIFF